MKKILIVEDVDLNIELLEQLLEDDYALAIAKDGQTGVDLSLSESPDLILMDMSLPVMDGWTATGHIKSNEATKSIPVIALTAHAMEGDKEKALSAGCDEFMTKPINEDLLFDLIEKYLDE